MAEQVKYSVIIPIYNAEKTIHRCVDSLLNQNYADMEIILVNDGSKDRSGEICREYASQHNSIVYIEKANGGVSTARNAGLDVAKGKYVLFVDSDDYVSEGYFRTLDALCADFDYDCVFFSHNIMEGTSCIRKELAPFASKNIDECVAKFCEAYYRKFLNSPINKRYCRSIIENHHLRFSEALSIGEDKVFCLQYILHCKSCCITSETLYNVSVDNKDSLSRKPRTDLSQQFAIIDKMVADILQSASIPEHHKQQYQAAENLIQLRAVYSEAKRMHLAEQPRKARKEVIRRMCKNLNAQKLKLPDGRFSTLLRIPVKLRLTFVIDMLGWYLAR